MCSRKLNLLAFKINHYFAIFQELQRTHTDVDITNSRKITSEGHSALVGGLILLFKFRISLKELFSSDRYLEGLRGLPVESAVLTSPLTTPACTPILWSLKDIDVISTFITVAEQGAPYQLERDAAKREDLCNTMIGMSWNEGSFLSSYTSASVIR